MLILTSSGGAEGIKFGVELRLRLDEAAAIIAHWLIARVWVLGDKSDDGSNEHKDKEDGGEGGIDNEEDDAEDAGDNALRRISTDR